MRGLFITGTDTGVGKTRVAAGLLRMFAATGLQAVGMKPIASGAVQTPDGLRNEDALTLQAAANLPRPYEQVNPYCFVLPIAPHLAAVEAGVRIELPRILTVFNQLCVGAEVVVVEGVGGWQVPLADDFGVPELARALGLPVILVVGMRLGCLNHALLSTRAILAEGLTLAGWVANGIDPRFERREDNLSTLTRAIPAPRLGDMPWQHGFSGNQLAEHLDAAKIIGLMNGHGSE